MATVLPLLILAAPPVLAAPIDYVFAPSDLTCEQVVSRHLEAVGGAEKARASGDPLATTTKKDAVELLGLSHVDGEPTYKLRITHADGRVEYHWIGMKDWRDLKHEAVAATPTPTASPVASTTPHSVTR